MTTSQPETHRLEPQDFVAAFGEHPDTYLSERIRAYPFSYRKVTDLERDEYLHKVIKVLLGSGIDRAGEQRHTQWESGWGANLQQLTMPFDFSAIVPGYFGKHGVVRWMQEYIAPTDKHFEYSSLAVIQDWLFNKYLRKTNVIYEFGCGTGHNLFRARAVNPKATLWGLDWTKASQEILAWLNRNGIDTNMYGHNFNLFEPDHSFPLIANASIYTVAALEQIGSRFGPFLAYILANKPRLCIHIEPIAELLDPTHLMDDLSIRYFKHRNYLDGFLSSLRSLEADGRVRVHMARRTYIGSLFIDGYSVIVWSPQ